MNRISGDIDLTQNLDFYRKNQKLLPKNIDLSKNQSDDDTIGVSNNNIYLSSNNVTYNTTIIDNTDEFNSLSFFSINDNTITIRYNTYTRSNNSTVYHNYSNIGFNFQYNEYSITDNIQITNNIIFNSDKSKYNLKEKAIKIWDNFVKSEPDNINNICRKCGKTILNPKKYKYQNLCKSCGSKKDLKFGKFSFFGFKFYHKDTIDNYDSYYGIPWDNHYESDTYNWEQFIRKNNSIRIPWLENLPNRIYKDYIEDLQDEQDYSSYLTNMGWLGIRE